jgi:DNA mismatch endonuclease, patch repair protein
MDIWSKEKRSQVMSRIRSKDTKPEILLRRLLHKAGYRFRVHHARLPGKPDIVLPKYKTAIFVHGCFWHQHSECREGRIPGTNRQFWEDKFCRTRIRDLKNCLLLEELDWNVIVVWECEIEKDQDEILSFIVRLISE